MKVCVIGNSHAAALRLGWKLIEAEFPGIELCFFAVGGEGFRQLEARDGRLVPTRARLRSVLEFTSGGQDEIDPAMYDLFLLYGLGFAPIGIVEPQGYSMAVRDAARRDIFRRSVACHVLTLLDAVTCKPILLGHGPFSTHRTNDLTPPADLQDYRRELDWYRQFLSSVILISQPEDTMQTSCTTRSEFSKGSRKLMTGDADDDEHHPEADTKHMNSDYGQRWLRCSLPILARIIHDKAEEVAYPCENL